MSHSNRTQGEGNVASGDPLVSVLQRPTAKVEDVAILIAKEANPLLDDHALRRAIDGVGAEALIRRGLRSTPERDCRILAQLVFEELGFDGERDDYYNPDNSYLDKVMQRRKGIPLSLSGLLMAVGERAGMEIDGVRRHSRPPDNGANLAQQVHGSDLVLASARRRNQKSSIARGLEVANKVVHVRALLRRQSDCAGWRFNVELLRLVRDHDGMARQRIGNDRGGQAIVVFAAIQRQQGKQYQNPARLPQDAQPTPLAEGCMLVTHNVVLRSVDHSTMNP